MEDLNGCIFCGNVKVKVHGCRRYYVACDACGMQGPRALIKAEAIARWNNASAKAGIGMDKESE